VTFAEALEFGEEGEEIIARFLVERGCVVSPLYQYEGHGSAPVLLVHDAGRLRKLIHPDLLVVGRERKVLFAEVKRKRRWTGPFPARRERGRETGFDERLYRHYCEVAERTGIELWLFFLHQEQEPTGIYAQRLSVLSEHVRIWNGRHESTGAVIGDGKALALFPESCLLRFADLPESEGHAP